MGGDQLRIIYFAFFDPISTHSCSFSPLTTKKKANGGMADGIERAVGGAAMVMPFGRHQEFCFGNLDDLGSNIHIIHHDRLWVSAACSDAEAFAAEGRRTRCHCWCGGTSKTGGTKTSCTWSGSLRSNQGQGGQGQVAKSGVRQLMTVI